MTTEHVAADDQGVLPLDRAVEVDAKPIEDAPEQNEVPATHIAVAGALMVGDASSALRVLHADPERLESIKLCYLDPPYNTGETFRHYSDKRDSNEWISELRGHLTALIPLLAPDASVWLHLDDSEQHRARVVMDEVFGREAFVSTIIWQKRKSRDNRKAFSSMHDYIHVYALSGPKSWKRVRHGLPDQGTFANPDNDPRGPWRSAPMSVQAGHATQNQFYTVVTPSGARHDPPPGRCWTFSKMRLEELVRDGRVYWPRGGAGKPRLKRYESESGGLAPFTIWTADEVGDTASAKKELLRDFPGGPVFDTPKPEKLLERIIKIGSDPGDTVLDYYLGSGTTAVVAQRLGRNWIGVEQNESVVEEYVIPRLRRGSVVLREVLWRVTNVW
ncbi:site-specific DNA-methyltransferase [Clavibacter sepedonicus]|nr:MULTISPECIES: site-specific DNA-methyltransferase [Clavibacter]MBD5383010.1 site-specific DNA-methyltransferase [Clavibacter sp.]UUK65611.1 site-specific DNA-methyltransferase [Clavibacter sepedonicus]